MFRHFWERVRLVVCILCHGYLFYMAWLLASDYPNGWISAAVVMLYWLYGAFFHSDIWPFIDKFMSKLFKRFARNHQSPTVE